MKASVGSPFPPRILFSLLGFGATGLLGQTAPAQGPREGAPSSETVLMDSFVVETTQIDFNPWQYVSIPGFEILSKADSLVTEGHARWMLNGEALEKEFVPPAFWRPLPVRPTLILFDFKPGGSPDSKVVPPVATVGNSDAWWGEVQSHVLEGRVWGRSGDAVTEADNAWNTDRFFGENSWDLGFDPGVATWQHMDECVPALPRWFEEGIAGPYGFGHFHPQAAGVGIPGPVWLSAQDTDALLAAAGKSKALPVLYPIRELFAHPEGESGPLSETWAAESALFVRWAYASSVFGDVDRKPAFFTFLERARREPVTEAMFMACFGFGYAEADRRLAAYLVAAAHHPVDKAYEHMSAWPPARPEVVQHRATNAEIARILGDWERLVGESLRKSNPRTSGAYFAAAGKLLEKAETSGSDEPALVAVEGLYEKDMGNTEKALRLLEAATRAGVHRPSAYIQLARLRFEAGREGGAVFTPKDVAGILVPIRFASGLERLPELTYDTVCDTLLRAESKPAVDQFHLARDGLAAYPLSAELHLRVAKVYAQWGEASEARAIIAEGRLVADRSSALQFDSLEKTLQRPASP